MTPNWTKHPMFSALTPDELKAAGAAAEGWNNEAIGALLNRSSSAAGHLLTSVYRKLHIQRNGNYHPRCRLTNLIIRAELVSQKDVLL